jgi:tripartite-type tricarboxylate transporter receptor subunit TctC
LIPRRALPFLAMPALAQPSFPERPVRFVVPFPPGGGTDVVSRELANRIQLALGWNIVIDNRPGAGGNIGLDAVAKAAPDGHTVGLGQTSNLAINPALYPTMPFDPLRDFTLISTVAQQPLVLVTAARAPFADLAAVVAAGQRTPLTAGHPGNGTVGHLTGELFARAARIEITAVPYRGAGQVVADLLARRIDLYFANPPSVRGLIDAGELRPLAVSAPGRAGAFPGVPRFVEAGYPGFVAQNWTGLVAPARLPPALLTRWNEAVRAALDHPDMRRQLTLDGSEPMGGTPEEFRTFLDGEHGRWGRVVREARIELS